MAAGSGEQPRERLVPVKLAARSLGRSADAVRDWVNDGQVPAVRTPGGTLSLYASWLSAVLTSARPGQVGDMSEVTARWYAERPWLVEEVA